MIYFGADLIYEDSMGEARGLPALEALLERSRHLVATSRAAMALSRESISRSVRRAAQSETRRAPCLTSSDLSDCDAAELAHHLRSALDQAAIDREVGFTTARLEGLNADLRADLSGKAG